MKKLKDQVKYILENHEDARNSDITLMIKLWETFYSKYLKQGSSGEVGIWLKDLYELPREDNIKRIRAVFQNEHNLYLPTDPKVRDKRGIAEENWLAFVRGESEFKSI